jgi:hypothetical protein
VSVLNGIAAGACTLLHLQAAVCLQRQDPAASLALCFPPKYHLRQLPPLLLMRIMVLGVLKA